MYSPNTDTLPGSVAWLGYGGLLPFVGTALAVLVGHGKVFAVVGACQINGVKARLGGRSGFTCGQYASSARQ